YFCVTSPSVHQMAFALERASFIRRQPSVGRGTEVLRSETPARAAPYWNRRLAAAPSRQSRANSDWVSVKGLADTEGDQNQRHSHQHPTGREAARPPKVTESAEQVEAADEYADREPHIPL